MGSWLLFVFLCLGVAGLSNGQNCILTVPSNPLTAAGLATPYTQVGCQMAGGTPSFAQAVVLDLNRATLFAYNPLVIDNGTLPRAAPVVPVLPSASVVGIWFGTNGRSLVLADNGLGSLNQGNCLNSSFFTNTTKFGHCNAVIFFQLAKTLIDARRIAIPLAGLDFNGIPCPTIRDFTVVDDTPSDGVTTVYLLDPVTNTVAQSTTTNRNLIPNALNLTNLSDQLVLKTLTLAFDCREWLIPDLADPVQAIATVATNEIQAIFQTSGPLALIPCNHPYIFDPFGQISLNKVNALRSALGQTLAANLNDCSTADFCANYVNIAPARYLLFQNFTSLLPSIDLTVADTLFNFLSQRFERGFGPRGLNCSALLSLPNPVTLTFRGNVVVSAQINLLPNVTTQFPQIFASPIPGAPTPVPKPTPAPTSAPVFDVINTVGLITASVVVTNGVMTVKLYARVNGYIALGFGGGHGSGSPGIICTISGITPICKDITMGGKTGLQASGTQLVSVVSGSLSNGRMWVTFTRPITGITTSASNSVNVAWSVSDTQIGNANTITAFHDVGQGLNVPFLFTSSPGVVPTPPPAFNFDDTVSSGLDLITTSVKLSKARNEIQVSLSAVCTGYIALAFGPHGSNSPAIVCWVDSTDGIGKCADAIIGSKTSTSFATTNAVTGVSGSFDGRTMSFTFVRSLSGITSDTSTPSQVFWAISNTSPTISNNAFTAFHGDLRGGPNLMFFSSDSVTNPGNTNPVATVPAGGVTSTVGPITVSSIVSGSQVTLSLIVPQTKRQTFGYVAIAFGSNHGTPAADAIGCWLDSTTPKCYELKVGGKSASGVVTGAQLTTQGGSQNGQTIFTFSHSLTFGATTLNPSTPVATFWAMGTATPINNQLAYHGASNRADLSSALRLSSSTNTGTTPPTSAPTTSTAQASNTIMGLSTSAFAILIIAIIAVLVGAVGFFLWRRSKNSKSNVPQPLPSALLFQPEMQYSPRGY